MVEQRYQAVLAVISDGLSVSQVAQKVGVSRQTVHSWLARYEAEGLEGLVDRSHRPAVVSASDAGSGGGGVVGVAAVAAVLGSTAAGVRAGQAQGVAGSLGVCGVSGVGAGADDRSDPARPALPQVETLGTRGPMELWQMDVVGGFPIADGTSAKVLTGIDDHSRMCVCARVMARERTRAVCDGLRAALGRYGAPEQILTDNGKVFTGRFNHPPVEVLFDAICRENGIEHLLTQPRSPTTTGKIERFHRSIRAEFLSENGFPHPQDSAAGPRRMGGVLQHCSASSITEDGHPRRAVHRCQSRRSPSTSTVGTETAPVSTGSAAKSVPTAWSACPGSRFGRSPPRRSPLRRSRRWGPVAVLDRRRTRQDSRPDQPRRGKKQTSLPHPRQA